MTQFCVLSKTEWTILQTHIKLAYPYMTEASEHRMSTWGATTNTTIKYSTCCVHHHTIARTITNFSLLFFLTQQSLNFLLLLIPYSALRGLLSSVINHIAFCTINSSVLAFSATIPVQRYSQYYKEIQLRRIWKFTHLRYAKPHPNFPFHKYYYLIFKNYPNSYSLLSNYTLFNSKQHSAVSFLKFHTGIM